MARPEKIRLGDLLVTQKLISLEQLQFALEQQKQCGRKLGRVLVDNALVTEEQISEVLALQLNIPFINLKSYIFNLDVVRRLPENQARRLRTVVLEERNGVLLAGMTDPTDTASFDEISRLFKCPVDIAVVTEGQLLEVIDRVYRRTEEIAGLAREPSENMGNTAVDLGLVGETAGLEDTAVVKLLQNMFNDATQLRASDIHIEPQEGKLKIRFRIDGELHLHTEADNKISPALVQRLKLMSALDISEKRLPQDGRLNIRVREQPLEAQISTIPTQFGEAVEMRLFNQSGGVLSLDKLGMPPAMLKRFREIIRRSSGMVLVSGPADSGKTSTLYAALAEVDTLKQKIITVEDPVEYRLSGINQVQVNENIALTFPRVLRAILRQDPDIILLGEMRDGEAAHLALHAAMSGHLVFSTLHTCDSAGALLRLADMGVPKFMLASSVQAVLAQRLLRRVCASCKQVYTPTPQEGEWLEHAGVVRKLWTGLVSGRGCAHCNGSGYRGRTGVFEMLEMNQVLVDAAAHEDFSHFKKSAREYMKGQTLSDHTLQQMLSGNTTVAEAMKVSSERED
jgi:MSHA biogenesis protein MshE